MKSLIILLLISATVFNACRETAEMPPVQPVNYENEMSFTVSRTGTGEQQDMVVDSIVAAFSYNVYPVLNKPGERDILFTIYPHVPTGDNVISRFSFSFLMSLPTQLFTVPSNPNVFNPLSLIDPEDYPLLLLDDDEENGRRTCMSKEGQNPDGSLFVDNACASEGWYGNDGDFDFEFTYHELFFDDNGEPNIYAEGKFEAETGSISGTGGKFKLSNGSFKLVIPLSLE